MRAELWSRVLKTARPREEGAVVPAPPLTEGPPLIRNTCFKFYMAEKLLSQLRLLRILGVVTTVCLF